MARYTDLLGPFCADAYVSSGAIVVPQEDTWPRVLFTFESHDVACAAFKAWQRESELGHVTFKDIFPHQGPILPGGKVLPKREA